MDNLQSRFEAAAQTALTLPQQPDNETMLRLYALFKQARAGDATGKRPGMFDMVGRAKHDAWSALSGMSPESAKQAYIDLVTSLV